jgi:molybdopterin converting factor subunit 1
MRVTVRLFARLRDLAGTGELIREVRPGASAREVWDDLVLEWPGLRDYEAILSVAVNAESARMGTAVQDGDEIAFMPPVSGGRAG